MKTFVVALFTAVALTASLARPARAQYSPAQYYNQFIPTLGIADQKAQGMNRRGLAWCLAQKGKVIGDGECTALVEMHLAVSGATPGNFKDPKHYIWGAVPNGWVPGDVLQFEDCYFEWKEGNATYKKNTDHHTAVIVSLQGTVVELVHQNSPKGGPVVVTKLDLKSKQRGTIIGWRPVGDY